MKWMPVFVAAGLAAGILTGWAVAGEEYDRVTATPRLAGQVAATPLIVASAPPRATRIATNRIGVGVVRPAGLHR
jgi:hypothetical protein